MRQAAELGAREYYVKPHSLAELIELLRAATTRWFTL
jgi:DNA-binding response OmpR family regulator